MNPLLLLVVSIALFSPATSGRPNYGLQLKAINSALKKETNSDDLEDNLAAAKQVLRHEQKFRIRLTGKDKELIKVLEEFLKLERVLNKDSICSPATGDLLRNFDIALRGKALQTQPGVQKDRIELVVYKFALEHTSDCRSIFEKQLIRAPDNLRDYERSSIDELVNLALKTFYNEPLDPNDIRRLDLGSLETGDRRLFKDSLAFDFLKNLRKVYWVKNALMVPALPEDMRKVVHRAISQHADACRSLHNLVEPIMINLNLLTPSRDLCKEEVQCGHALMSYAICDYYLKSLTGVMGANIEMFEV